MVPPAPVACLAAAAQTEDAWQRPSEEPAPTIADHVMMTGQSQNETPPLLSDSSSLRSHRSTMTDRMEKTEELLRRFSKWSGLPLEKYNKERIELDYRASC